MMKARRGELAKAMAEADLNQGELATKARVSPPTVARARHGFDVRMDSAHAMARALGRRLEELFVHDESAEGQAA